jgi:hypothetical protein
MAQAVESLPSKQTQSSKKITNYNMGSLTKWVMLLSCFFFTVWGIFWNPFMDKFYSIVGLHKLLLKDVCNLKKTKTQ